VVGVAGLVVFVLAFTVCVGGAGTLQPTPSGEIDTELARVQGQLSTRDALLDAAVAQKENFSKEGSYTSDVELITRQASYVGVELEIFLQGPNDYCMQAVHGSSGVVKHITEADPRPRRGTCPTT
jgi:hypothetical protein